MDSWWSPIGVEAGGRWMTPAHRGGASSAWGWRGSHWSRPRSCFFCLSAGLLALNNTNLIQHVSLWIVNCWALSQSVVVTRRLRNANMCCGVWERPDDMPSTVWPTACRYRAVFFSALCPLPSLSASSRICLFRARSRGREGSQASVSSHHGVLIRGASSRLESDRYPSRLDSVVTSRKTNPNSYNQSSPGRERVEPLMGCWTARMGGCKSCDRHPHARQTAMT